MPPLAEPPSDLAGDGAVALRALAQKAAAAPRLGVADFDWTVRPVLPRLAPRAAFVRGLSQFLHGERIAGQVCAALRPRLAVAAARDCLARQQDDEARHAEIYARYLMLLGGAAPAEPALARAAQTVLAWRGAPEAMVLACHLLLETEALRLDQAVGQWSPCPLLRRIGRSIGRDEARHVAFGKLYLRDSLQALPPAEQRAIHDWLSGLWHDTAAGMFDGVLGGLVPAPLRRGFAARRWPARARALRDAGLLAR